MFSKICFCLIVYISYLKPFSSAEYQYLGVRNVNQMEPPSLESMGSLEGQSQHNQEQGGSPMSAGHGRSMGGQHGGGDYPGGAGGDGQKDCDKPNNGWRQAAPNDKPMMRSMNPKKPCKKGRGGRGGPGNRRSLDNQPDLNPDIKMLDRKKEESPLQEISRTLMNAREDQAEEKDLKPNVKEKIETFTETYMVTSLATRVITRKRLFMQKRKIVNQKINKPIVVVRRKIIKERQIFERIVPKIIETREIINNPVVKSKVVEGPIYELPVEQPPPPNPGMMRNLDEGSEDCPEVEFDPNSGDTIDGAQAVYGSPTGYGYLGSQHNSPPQTQPILPEENCEK